METERQIILKFNDVWPCNLDFFSVIQTLLSLNYYQMKNSVALLILFVLLFSGFKGRSANEPTLFVSQYENVLGTSMEIKVAAGSPEVSELADRAVLDEIGRLSKILSGYDRQSEFSRWFATNQAAVHVSPELYEVLSLFDQWRERTSGALDASAEAIVQVWKKAAAGQMLPSHGDVESAIELVKRPHWRLDPVAGTATHLDRTPLVLNSFAKSYIIGHAVSAGRKVAGVSAIVLNIGGDIVVSGQVNEAVLVSNPKADAENDLPIDKIRVGNSAVATSGNYRRGELIAGKWYSHIVDPRTGMPADGVISATVVAESATDAGALATAFNVLSVPESIALASGMEHIEYLIITKDGRRVESPGWKKLEERKDQREQPAAGSSADPFELLVNLEINLQKEGSVKRPYVAVWVEDMDHAPVRTITLWHGSDRYLPELRSWYLKYRGVYTSDPKFGPSVTSATRSAGKYSVKWDGKDDKGNEVKPGKYVIKIEVSREHGTYQLMRQELDWNDQPKTLTLPGNIEISSASLDFRKKTNGN